MEVKTQGKRARHRERGKKERILKVLLLPLFWMDFEREGSRPVT